MADNIDNLINQMKNARSRLEAAIEKISPQLEIYPSWKLKQLMDHITGWDELVASAFQAHSSGEIPVKMIAKGINDYNEKSLSERGELSMESSRQAYFEARVKLFQTLQKMPYEKFSQKLRAPWGGTCTVGSVLKIFISHELEHAKHIEEMLAKSAK